MMFSKTISLIFSILMIATALARCKKSASNVNVKEDRVPSFKEVLKDGHQRDHAFEMMNPQGLSAISTEELRTIVRGYVNSQGQSANYWKIVALMKTDKDRLTPLLIEIVLEPNSETRAKELDKDILYETPLKRALMRLSGVHPELLPRLLDLSHSSAPFVRRDIAQELAAFGTDAVIPAILSFLSEPKAPESHYAMSGIWEAVKEGRAASQYRQALIDPIAKIVAQGGHGDGSRPARLLLLLDAERGKEVLLNLLESNDYKSLGALEALNEAKMPVDAALLLKLLELNDSPGAKEMWRYSLFGSALLGLAQQHRPEAHLQVEKILAEKPLAPHMEVRRFDNGSLRRKEAASVALLALENFTMPSLWERYEKLGRDKISEVECDLLSMADAEISNGGMGQYFFNIDYDPREDVATLKRLGASQHAAILERSFKAFGWWGPSASREKRIVQLEKMSDTQSQILDAGDDAWFTATESLTVLTNLYALRHRQVLEAIATDNALQPSNR